MDDSNDKLYLCSMSFTKLHIPTPDPADKMRIKDMNMEEVKTRKLLNQIQRYQKKPINKRNCVSNIFKSFYNTNSDLIEYEL